MIKYYMDPRSGSCRRVSTVIAHLGLEVEEIFVDLLNGGNRTPDFLELNPNAMVPVLTDGDLVLWEASAIMIHLCQKHGPSSLWPEGDQRLEVLKWMFWAAEHFRVPAPVYFEENVIAPLLGKAPDVHRLEDAERRIGQFAPVLEQHLSERDFVCGTEPTLADLDLAAVLSQMPRSHVPYRRYQGILNWADRLETALPAWKATGDLLNRKMDEATEAARKAPVAE